MGTGAREAREQSRLGELAAYQIMDTAPEAAFDAIVLAATLVAGVPAAGIGLLDDARQWFKARVGIDLQDVPADETICRTVVDEGVPLVLADVRDDPRFGENPHVAADGGLRFYAGFPLRTPSGNVLGTLCLNDTVAHELTTDQVQVLWTLADQAMAQIELRRQATEAATAREISRRRADLLAGVLESIDVGVLVCDADGRLVSQNACNERLYGVGLEPGQHVDDLASQLSMTYRDGTAVPVEQRPLRRILAEGSLTDMEVVVRTRDDEVRYVRIHGTALTDPDGQSLGAVRASHDITAIREREADLSARVRDVEALAEASRSILGAGDAAGAACEAALRVCGAQHASIVMPTTTGSLLVTATTSRSLAGFEVPLDADSMVGRAYTSGAPQFVDLDRGVRTYTRAVELLRAEYGEVHAALYMPLVHDGECLGVLLMTTDDEIGKLPSRIFGYLEIITAELSTRLERDRLRSELATQASTDPLTGLANRRSWDERVSHAVIAAGEAPLSMALLDLDHFKMFNDSCGHQAGDLLLRESAAAWSREIRSGDLLARLGGEEFGLLLHGCTADDAMGVLNALRLAVPQEQTVSIGVSERRPDETITTWYARTDRALYAAKENGRNCVVPDGDPFVERRRHPVVPLQAEPVADEGSTPGASGADRRPA